MAVRVRLTRVGNRKNAIWRVVVADQRSPRDGRFIEMIGHYNPQTEPSQIVINRERLDHWLHLGAEPSNTVRKLMRAQNSESGAATAVATPEVPTDESTADADAETEAAAAAGREEAAPEGESMPDTKVDAPPEAHETDGGDEAPGSGSG